MWLATRHGFYSIIQQEPGVYSVSARMKRDLENLLQASGVEHEIHHWSSADCRYRIIIGSEDLLKVVVSLTATIDYANFKDFVAQQEDQCHKLPAYHEIWAVMSRCQCER